jgi:hypothetical protein
MRAKLRTAACTRSKLKFVILSEATRPFLPRRPVARRVAQPKDPFAIVAFSEYLRVLCAPTSAFSV